MISYLVIQQVEGYLLTPLIEGKITSLHPAAMIAAITVAGAAFGFLGVFLAVPVRGSGTQDTRRRSLVSPCGRGISSRPLTIPVKQRA
jgi:hypothetical protein